MNSHHKHGRPRNRQKSDEIRKKISTLDRLIQSQLLTRISGRDVIRLFRMRAIDGSFVTAYVEGPTYNLKLIPSKTGKAIRLGSVLKLRGLLAYYNPKLPKKVLLALSVD